MKLDLNDSISSFPYVVVDENIEFIKWYNRLGHIEKYRTNILAKDDI